MTWPWRRPHRSEDDQRRREAAEQLEELRERAQRVAPLIEQRKRENHWTQTVQHIVRGGA